MKYYCSRCGKPIAEERGNCPSCKEIILQEKIDKQVNRKVSKLKNTVYYGLDRVKQVAEGRFWATAHSNCFRCSKAEKEPHIRMKFERYLKHIQLGRTVFTELILKKDMGRPDLVVVDKGFVFVEEIVNSEKEASIIKKKLKYPFPIQIIKVDKK